MDGDRGGDRSTWEALGEVLYRTVLRLVPGWLRARAGDAMAEAFRARQQERLARSGPLGLPPLWLRELGGLILTAARGYLSGPRTPATAEDAPRSAGGPPHEGGASPSSTAAPAGGGGSSLERLLQDVRFAGRTFVRRPVPMVLAVATFGLGVGAATAMVSVVDVLLLRDLPYPESHELVAVYPTLPAWREIPELAEFWQRGRFSPVELEELRGEQSSFEGLGAMRATSVTVVGDDVPPEVLRGLRVTPELLDVLGVVPVLGRGFGTGNLTDDPPVLLAHGVWVRRFGADPDVVGRTLRADDRSIPILGVLPEGFSVPGRDADFFLPVDLSSNLNRDNHGYDVLGRLADGVTPARAEEEVGAILLRHVPGPDHAQHGASVVPLQDDLARSARTPALVLLAASLVLLLVACGNVAAILLGVGIGREAELGVRRAMGADRRRIVGQLVTESVVLAVLGAVLALGVASGGVDLLLRLVPEGFPGVERVGVDARVLLIGLGLAGLGALVAGLFPALTLSRVDLGAALRSARTASPRAGRVQSAVVVGELALATVLLAGAGLLTRTLVNLNALDTGFNTEEVVALDLSTSLHYSRLQAEDPEGAIDGLRRYVQRVVEAVEAVPGVRRVAATTDIPLGPARANNAVWPTDRALPEEEQPVAERRSVTPGYFETLGIGIVAGRAFTEADAATLDSVVVVSEGLARALWPDGPATGRFMGFWAGEYRVVGVAENLRDERLARPSELAFYVPMQTVGSIPGSLLVRASDDPAGLVPALRRRVWEVDPDVPITTARPLSSFRREAVAEERYRARLLTVFSGLATLFALMGIYGVTHRVVARRRREMGIRLALGARASGIYGLMIRRSLAMGVVGVLLGILVAVPLGRTLEELLYGVEATDPVTLVGIGGMLLLAVILASLGPSIRAMRVNPTEALRME